MTKSTSFVRVPGPIQAGIVSTNSQEMKFPPASLSLCIGGSKSGKSKIAESWAESLAQSNPDSPLIYVATLDVGEDPENLARVARHREQRTGQDYRTLELPQFPEGSAEIPDNAIVLFECLGTLLANRLFSFPEALIQAERIALEITEALQKLAERSRALLILSNDVHGAAESYSPETQIYLQTLGKIHRDLSKGEGSAVIEVIMGIPLLWKSRAQTDNIVEGSVGNHESA